VQDSFKNRDIISIRDFTREEIDFVLELSRRFAGRRDQSLGGHVLGTLFFEPSTRTRLSFEAAMSMLGGRYISFAEPGATSIVKGETLQDTIRVVEGYCDVIVMRHPLEGAARLAAEVSRHPVINGGDGANQHPTQTLLDLYTIRQSVGRLDGLRIAMVGDLRYGRTVHSLAEALTRYDGCHLTFVSPPALRMPRDVREALDGSGTSYREVRNLEELEPVDILYVTRIQQERFPDPVEYQRVRDVYRLDRNVLRKVGEEVKIMHPLPRVNEIAPELDSFEGSLYFQQAHNGVTVRQTLLALVLGVVP
jgi:aspartate carbamoyltransferase catalytic subunit